MRIYRKAGRAKGMLGDSTLEELVLALVFEGEFYSHLLIPDKPTAGITIFEGN
jgi:hypothetical protein